MWNYVSQRSVGENMSIKHSTNMVGTIGKVCSHCRLWYSLNKFGKDKSRMDGFECRCKNCKEKYGQTEECKSSHKKYNQSGKGKIVSNRANKKYRESKHGKLIKSISDDGYRKSNHGKMIKAKLHAKERGLGFNPINNNLIAESYVWHHVNHNDVISIPTDIHELYTGSGFKSGKHEFMVLQIIKQLQQEGNINDYNCR